ncbi:MAG: hypothetical protein WAM90_03835 [Rhodanobacter sp.]
MHIFKKRHISALLMSGAVAIALSACGGQQTAAQACTTINVAGATLLPDLHSAAMSTSSDPAGTLKKFQAMSDSFRDATKSVTNVKAKAAVDTLNKDLDSIVTIVKDIDAAGKSGKSQDDLHQMVVDRLQPVFNTFQEDWNNQLGAACSAP